MLRARRGSLQRLAEGRVYRNKPLGKPRTWAFFVAEIAWLLYRRGGDLASFRRAAPQVPRYFVISDAVALKALRQVGRRKKWREQCGESYRPTSPAKLGKALAVTAEEYEELDLTTIRPAGWTPELAAAEHKARKLERDRKRRAKASAKERQREAKRKRAWRARRGRGLARAVEAQRKREEIAASDRSRATWYRRRETDGVRETKRVRAPILPVRERGRLLSHRTAAAAGSKSNGHLCQRRAKGVAKPKLTRIIMPPPEPMVMGVSTAWEAQAFDRWFSGLGGGDIRH
jgi:hypothetical protein